MNESSSGEWRTVRHDLVMTPSHDQVATRKSPNLPNKLKFGDIRGVPVFDYLLKLFAAYGC
eukprot:3303230-Pyramimonas_sp.AAC.1